MRSSFHRFSLLAAAVFVASASLTASAADAKVEAQAKKLQSDAMDVDFLSLDLKKAKKKLEDALKKCGKNKCSSTLLATLQRDHGIVQINAGDKSGGAKSFESALGLDAGVTIGKDYLANADVAKAWEEAKKKKGIGAAPSGGGGGGGDDGGEGAPAPAEGGLGVKVTMAPMGYELPILVTAPSEAASVKVSYKTEGMEKYRPVEAKKSGGKWLVVLPCDATSKTGTIKLYVKAFDDSNGEIEHYGTIKKPGQIKIVDHMPDDVESPTLPGGKDPKECGAAADSGEGGGGGGKPEGSGCSEDEDCEKGLVCVANDEGKKWCKPGEKKAKSGETNKLWIGIDGQIDLVFLGHETNLCKLDTWACSANTPDGRQDVGISDSAGINVTNGSGGKTDGGMATATKRIFLSLDYFVVPHLTLGGRLGYAFGGNPTTIAKFVPLHLEARAQYFITEDVFRPYFLLGFGFGEMDAPVPNVIVEPNDPAKANACSGGEAPPCDTTNPSSRPLVKGVTAYKLVGPWFAQAGIGAWLMVGKNVAINVAGKFVFPLPTFAFTIAPEAGLKFSF